MIKYINIIRKGIKPFYIEPKSTSILMLLTANEKGEYNKITI